MRRAMPLPAGPRRYRLRGEVNADHPEASLAGALQAYADDLLETGDARLALERAFRWGYRQEDGEQVEGLQERTDALRQQRERLRRQVERDDFLEAIAPDLDRLDAMAGEEPADGSALDRLADRLERGYDDAEEQAQFDDIVASLQAMAGDNGGVPDRADARRSDESSFFPSAGSSRQGKLDRVKRMLFQGGVEGEKAAAGAWKLDNNERRRSLTLDLDTLARLNTLDRELAALGSVGGVLALSPEELARLRQTLSEDSAQWLAGWAGAAEALRARRESASHDAASSLPPDVLAAIGRDLLRNFFRAAAAPVSGEHATPVTGTAGDAAESSAPWEAGRPLDLDLLQTLGNAIRRGETRDRGQIRLRPDDFAVVERTARTAVSTVLAIDRSRSMGQSGAWTAAKRVTLAMHELIRQSYPRDSLSVVAFSSGAEAVTVDALAEMQWDRFEHGTDLQSALALGRRLLQVSPAGTRQIVVITDGEPTAAMVKGDRVFSSPPTPEVLEATMR